MQGACARVARACPLSPDCRARTWHWCRLAWNTPSPALRARRVLPDSTLLQHATSSPSSPGFSASRFHTQTGGWTKHLPQREQGHVGDPSWPTCGRVLCPAVRGNDSTSWMGRGRTKSSPGREFSRQSGPGSHLFQPSTRRFPGSLPQTAGHSRVENLPAVLVAPGSANTGLFGSPVGGHRGWLARRAIVELPTCHGCRCCRALPWL